MTKGILIRGFGLLMIPLLSLLFLSGCGGGGGGGSGSSSGGTTTTATTSMSVGGALLLGFTSGESSVSFDGASGTYEILIQSGSTSASSSTFSLSSESLLAKSLGLVDPLDEVFLEDSNQTAQTQFEKMLRDEERFLTSFPLHAGMSKSLSQAKGGGGGGEPNINPVISVNDTDNFRVLDSLNSVTSYDDVTATAKCVNDEVAVFIDNEILTTNPADLPQSDIDTLCEIYQTHLPTLRSNFGGYSDINSDEVVVALITPTVNRLPAGGGIVTGFFYSGDLFDRSADIPASNQREIVYILTPDSGGIYGTKVTNAFAMSNFLPSVFFHEVQHLINYYEHTIARSGSAEKDWLNEGLSHLAEDLTGYNRENYSRYDLYLASPQSYALVASGSPGLAQRGASYLFLRYLYEQSGKSDSFVKGMNQTTSTGTANVVAAYPSKTSDFDTFEEFLQNWAIALAYTDRGLTTTGKYKYDARTTHSTTGNYHGACMICTAGDGRGTVLTGPSYGTFSSGTSYSVKESSTRFLNISSLPTGITISANSSFSPAAIVLKIK